MKRGLATPDVPTPDRDLDVAISFNSEDAGIAVALRAGLAPSLRVFEFTDRQQELAGTDGLESLRSVFRSRARLVVILLRAAWGHTNWTRVELDAITDRFLKEGPEFLFVITTDDGLVRPPWLPDKLLRFHLKDFPIEQAIGAIRARCLEQGGVVSKPTVSVLAALAQERIDFQRRRGTLLGNETGVREANGEARRLVEIVGKRVAEVKAAGSNIGVEYGAAEMSFVIRASGVAVTCGYRNRILNSLRDARLVICDMRGAVLLPGQSAYYVREPKVLEDTEFRPDLSISEGWCWRDGNDALHSSESIAELCVVRFLALVEADAAEKLPGFF